MSPALGGIVGGTGELASGMVLASYSRDQERDADQRGIALAARAGWDPAGLASFLHTLEREEALAGHDPNRPGFFATHPATPERVGNVRTAARSQTRATAAPFAGSRGAFLQKLEGLVVGDNPASGVFLGPLFVHPVFDVALEMPTKWKTINRLTTTRRAVCGISTKPPAAAATHVRIQNSVAAEESHFNCSETIVASRATPAALNRIFQEPGRIVTAVPAAASPKSKSATQTPVQD